MEANREARQEGMRIFEKRVFNNCDINIESPFKPEGEKPQCTWLNPDLDTIYFGENTCVRTVAYFLDLCWHTKLPKIAFAINRHVQISCDCSPSTTEVSIVIPSLVYKFAAGEMTNTATLRSSVHEDLCVGGPRPGSLWAMQMRRIRSDVYGCGTSRWTNGSGSDFKFSSFGPSIKDGKGKRLRHHGFTICDKKFKKITMGTFLEDLKLRTGVDIRIGVWSHSKNFPSCYDQVNEVGVFNETDEGIKECGAEIWAHCHNEKCK
ncbi:hypothetical protein BOTNAR_0178g00180 [Botryotinia narcissicola]|uniref:Uncharacterized protein n=1 Tax=Botryotinia narcissicola TaxID=278944 RepID=A0A4Z1IAK4_9HELO|nr:hypothetical protein BOTNAR_0178g00180 [Botryotinia narcissicola]